MTGSNHPKLSVMIPVRNEQQHLAKAVESVIDQNYPGEIEILLAIAPSQDQTLQVANELATKHDFIRLIDNPAGLTTIGLNKAIAASSGEIIIRLDAHSQLSSGYLLRGVEILRQQNAVLLGGIMNAKGETNFQSAVAFGYRSRIGLGGGRYHLGGKEGEAESAYLGIFDAAKLRDVGGYDERIIRGEDWDLAQRLKKEGLVWFSPELVVDYWPRSNWPALIWQFYSTGLWRGELSRRASGKLQIRYLIPPITLFLMIILSALLIAGLLPFIAFLIPLAIYLLLCLLAAVSAKGLGLAARALILLVLPTMHLSWASGFWIGFFFGAGQTVDSGKRR